MGCFDEEDRRLEQEEDQDVEQYIQQFLECQQIENQAERHLENGEAMQMYATWCCNADGDGIRMCLYVDEQCSVKYTGESFYDLYGANSAAYSNSKAELAYALNYPVSCAGEIEYDELGNEDEQQEEDNQEEEEEAEAAEFCQNLINNEGNNEEGAEVIGLSDCAYNGDQEEEQQEEEEDEADYGGYDYWYQVAAYDAQNFQQLCYQVQNLNGEGYWTTEEYDEATYDQDTDQNSSFNGLSTGAEVAIALIVLAVVALIGFVAWKFATKSKDKDEKEFHLVEDRKGQLA